MYIGLRRIFSQFQRNASYDLKSVSIVLYSSLYSLTLRSLRSLRFNHSNATGIHMRRGLKRTAD
jgi:hypothetical protein